MGRSYLFECPKCGYKASVSGGAGRGYDFHVQTIVCRDCQKLHDAVTRLRAVRRIRVSLQTGVVAPLARERKTALSDTPPTFDAAVNRLPLRGTRFRWIQFKLRCPVSPLHRVQSWKTPGQCPRCGVFLERSALPFRVWE